MIVLISFCDDSELFPTDLLKLYMENMRGNRLYWEQQMEQHLPPRRPTAEVEQ